MCVSVHLHLPSCKTSSESNPLSTSAAKCASNGANPGEKVRFQCFVFLRNFCRMLSPAFVLCSIVNIRQRSNFFLACYVTVFFVVLNSSLNPVVYCWRYREIRQIMKRTVKKYIPLHRDLRWNKDVRVIDLSLGDM